MTLGETFVRMELPQVRVQELFQLQDVESRGMNSPEKQVNVYKNLCWGHQLQEAKSVPKLSSDI
jgi:hypothetical protein